MLLISHGTKKTTSGLGFCNIIINEQPCLSSHSQLHAGHVLQTGQLQKRAALIMKN